MSDRGIPASYREMHGFGSHTYSLINAQGERFWVKFHFKSKQGIRNLTNAQVAEIIAKDRESRQRDLYESIEKGRSFKIQVLHENEVDKLGFNPFDLTKTWSHKVVPLIEVGKIILNRNPKNYFNEVEQQLSALAISFLELGLAQIKCYKAESLAILMRTAIALEQTTISCLSITQKAR